MASSIIFVNSKDLTPLLMWGKLEFRLTFWWPPQMISSGIKTTLGWFIEPFCKREKKYMPPEQIRKRGCRTGRKSNSMGWKVDIQNFMKLNISQPRPLSHLVIKLGPSPFHWDPLYGTHRRWDLYAYGVFNRGLPS